MLYLSHKPLPPLSDFVDVLWLYEGYDVPHEKERLLPDGCVELVINLAEDRIRVYDSHDPEKSYTIPGCVVSGPRSEFFVIDTAARPHDWRAFQARRRISVLSQFHRRDAPEPI